MEYRIVSAGAAGPSPEKVLQMLQDRMQAMLKDGWQPTGGLAWLPRVAIAPGSDDIPFFYVSQAITRG